MIPVAFPQVRYLQNLLTLRYFLILEIHIRGPDPGQSAVRYGAIPRDGAQKFATLPDDFFKSAHALRLGFTKLFPGTMHSFCKRCTYFVMRAPTFARPPTVTLRQSWDIASFTPTYLLPLLGILIVALFRLFGL